MTATSLLHRIHAPTKLNGEHEKEKLTRSSRMSQQLQQLYTNVN